MRRLRQFIDSLFTPQYGAENLAYAYATIQFTQFTATPEPPINQGQPVRETIVQFKTDRQNAQFITPPIAMFGNEHFLISELDSITSQHPEVEQKPLMRIADEHLQFGVAAKAIDIVMRDQSVSPREAMAMICHYFLVSEGIDPIGENPLLNPAEYGRESERQTRLRRVTQWLLSEG